LNLTFNEDKPIYLQVKEYLENSIINGSIEENERVPSTNEFAKFYNINPATAAKGVNELVSEGIITKRRGVGMFVSEGARAQLLEDRRENFYQNYVLPLKTEAHKLEISEAELIKMINGRHLKNES